MVACSPCYAELYKNVFTSRVSYCEVHESAREVAIEADDG
jgi:hypothetical protein